MKNKTKKKKKWLDDKGELTLNPGVERYKKVKKEKVTHENLDRDDWDYFLNNTWSGKMFKKVDYVLEKIVPGILLMGTMYILAHLLSFFL